MQLTCIRVNACVQPTNKRLAVHRQQVEQELSALRAQLEQQAASTKEERAQVEHNQRELDRLGVTLKQVEEYNEKVGGRWFMNCDARLAGGPVVSLLAACMR
jgi:hypothetical protein